MSLSRPPRPRPLSSPAQSARGMRALATAMLAGMAAIFVAATGLEPRHPAWGFVRAFAEAGAGRRHRRLVRGHRPVPPPARPAHPAHRDRAAQQGPDRRRARLLPQGQFPHPLGGRAADAAISTSPARSAASSRQPPGEGRLRAGRLAPARRHPGSARSGAARRHGQDARSPSACARVEIAPLLGQTLEAAITEERHVPMVDGIVTWAGRTLDANEDLIRDMVHKRAGWILRMAGLDEKLADAIVDGLRKLTIDMAVDPAPSAARQGRGRPRPPRRRPPARSRDPGQGRGVEERDDRE